MITATVVCVALFAQAASVDWSVANKSVKDDAGEGLGGATYYLVNTSASSWNMSLFSDGTVTSANITDQAFYLGSGTGSTSSKSLGGMSTKTVTNAQLTEGQYYDLAYVIFNDGKYFVSGTGEAQAYDPTGSIETEGKPVQFASAQFASPLSSGGWATAAPEPTSGLLLLLGMAGLALKRKHA